MTNFSFTNTCNSEKKKNLSEVLSRRCNGLIRKDVIDSIVARLDYTKQMKIDVVNKSTVEKEARKRTTVNIVDGKITDVSIQWVRCLLGKVNFGEDVVFVEDGEEVVKKSSSANIISNPAIIQLDNQHLGEVDSSFIRLLVVM